ncbi:MAG: SPOR domain-containing protein [Synergistaceae bacterium]|nr:SPOR domain-containing protein [Synergistaceae bacterium]
MISRKTRSYKEKKKISLFGQILLPIALLMALALLYFSIKLFFFTHKEPLEISEYKEPAGAAHQTVKNPDYSLEEEIDDMEDIETITPRDEPEKSDAEKPAAEPKPKAPVKPVQPAREVKPAAPVKPASGPRWDVQIGGFAARSGAEVTVKEARAAGYAAYVEDSVLNGKPFYKVRVRGTASKTETAELSKKLEKAGFPVYIVEIKR